MKKPLKINLLGNFHLTYNDSIVPGVDSPRLQSFLAYLLVNRQSPHQRQQLAYLFWPDSSESQARTNLRNMLYRVREALPDAEEYLEISSQTLWWKPDSPFILDLIDFEDAVAHTDQTGSGKDQKAHRQALEAAVNAYNGELLSSCYDDWIFPERERLNQTWLRILEELIEILELDQEYDQAIELTQQLLRADPFHEDSYRRLMELFNLNDDKVRAIRTYHRCVDILEKELGLDPSPATVTLYQNLMARDAPELSTPTRVSEKGAQLVGRDDAWHNLHQSWAEAERRSRVALIMGEAGIGKTYLAEEFTRWARREGIRTLITHSYHAEGELAYNPLTRLLRSDPVKSKLKILDKPWLVELTRLVPELESEIPDLPPADQLTENWQRQRLFEASARAVLAGENKLVILLDDLQWCDWETLDWLGYLLEYDTTCQLMIVACVRIEDLTADNPLLSLFAKLEQRGRFTEILLDRLDQDATRELASDLWGEELPDEQVLTLYQETEGNPLFVAEMVRAGYLKEGPSEQELPPLVQAVIETRLNTLSPTARDIATIAAVVGREFEFELLLQAGEGEEETQLQGLDELWGRRLIQDAGEDGYNFSHDKFREVIYQGLSPHRRKYYHQKVADALVIIHSEALENIAPRLASHYNLAGRTDQAIDFYLLAGDQARLIFARQNAIEHYQRAADLLKKKSDPRLIRIYHGWGEVLIKLTTYDQAAETYHKMLRAAEKVGDWESQARAWLAIGTAQDRQGEHQNALESADKALFLAKKHECDIEQTEAILLKGQSYYRLGDVVKAQFFINGALDLCLEGNDQFTSSRCLSLLGLIQDELGDFERAREFKEQALSAAEGVEGSEIKGWRGTVFMNLANSENLRGKYTRAVELYLEALEIFQETKNQDMVFACLVNMSAAKSGLGDHGEAEADLRKVLELARDQAWMGKPITYFLLAETCLSQGKYDEAYRAAQESLDHADQTRAQQAIGAAWRVLGKSTAALDQDFLYDDKNISARDCFAKSEGIYNDLNAEAERAQTIKAWAEYEKEKGDNKEGQRLWQEAKEIFQRLEMGAEVEKMEESE